MGYISTIISKLLTVQDKIYPDAKEYIDTGEGKISLLRVVGIDGETLLLKVQGKKIQYADKSDKPTEIFKCSSDTFLDIISGDVTLREAITKSHFTIENAKTMRIDIIEMEKWAKAFTALHRVVAKHLGS